jgi:hypothetical protein
VRLKTDDWRELGPSFVSRNDRIIENIKVNFMFAICLRYPQSFR